MDAITWLNRVPNKNTTANNQSPYQLVTDQKTFLPIFSFGQTGLFYSKKRDGQLSEWRIVVEFNPRLRSHLQVSQQATLAVQAIQASQDYGRTEKSSTIQYILSGG